MLMLSRECFSLVCSFFMGFLDCFSDKVNKIRSVGDDSTDFDAMMSASQLDLTIESNFNTLRRYMDFESFSDYLLINFYIGKSDWPTNNFNIITRSAKSALGPMPARFICSDAEFSWTNAFMVSKPQPGAWVCKLPSRSRYYQ
jgi:hypothetical protein